MKCRDSGAVLEKERLAKAEKMKTEDEQECAHELKDYEDLHQRHGSGHARSADTLNVETSSLGRAHVKQLQHPHLHR